MRSLIVASSVLLASVVFVGAVPTGLTLPTPPDASTPARRGTHMLKLTMANDLFQSLVETMATMVPSQINGIRIPDLKGSSDNAPTSMGVALYSGTNYEFTNISFTTTTMNRDAVIKLGENVIDFNVDVDLNVIANYKLSTTKKITGNTEASEGLMNIKVKHASVSGNLTLTRNERKGLAINVDHFESKIEKMYVNLEHKWYLGWMDQFLNVSGKPIVTTAIGSIIGSLVPQLVNNLFMNTATRGTIMADGRRVQSTMEVVNDPVITPAGLMLDMDLKTEFLQRK